MINSEIDSQCNSILKHLQSGKPITPIDALNLYGCFRLGARIHDLRKKGHLIQTKTVKQGNKSFAEYSLN